MLSQRVRKNGAIISVTLATLLTVVCFSKIVRSPSELFLGAGEDAGKNYYTLLYFVFHNRSWLHFEGMNYPFGEHLVFTDAQPLLAWAMKAAGLSMETSIAAMNGLLLISLPITTFVLYVIHVRLGLRSSWAIGSALISTFLSPILLRLQGHYGLAYSFLIPLQWYLLIRSLDGGRWIWPVSCGLLATVTGFIHPYWSVILSAFAGAFFASEAFFRFLRREQTWNLGQTLSKIFIATLTPVGLFKLFMTWTDPITDRPVPPDHFYYRSYFDSLFVPPPWLPTRGFWTAFMKVRDLEIEHYLYVGCFFVPLLILIARRILVSPAKASLILRPSKRKLILRTSAMTALILFTYSMGYPMRLFPSAVLETMGPLLQFRSLARFAQPTYFIAVFFTFYIFSLCDRFLRMRGLRFSARSLTALVFIFLAMEAASQTKYVASNLGYPSALSTERKSQVRLWISEVSVADYQAILPLPFFQIGTEDRSTLYNKNYLSSFTNSLSFSLLTGLPLFGSHLSRTSEFQGKAEAALIQRTPAGLKAIKERLKDHRPVLVLVTPPVLDPQQIELLNRTQLLKRYSDVEVRRIQIDELLSP